MHSADLLTGWDTAILTVPFIGLLAFWMFGLDERVAAPRERSTRRRFCVADGSGPTGFCDPDGRPAGKCRPILPSPPYRSGTVEIPTLDASASAQFDL
jgi:hypothetical protein